MTLLSAFATLWPVFLIVTLVGAMLMGLAHISKPNNKSDVMGGIAMTIFGWIIGWVGAILLVISIVCNLLN